MRQPFLFRQNNIKRDNNDEITEIGAYVFANYTELTSINFSNNVITIENYAFLNCSGLVEVAIPNSVKTIGEGAFSGCRGLKSITLPFVGGSANATVASPTTLFGYIFGKTSYSNSRSTTQYYDASNSVVYYVPYYLTNVEITGGQLLYGAFRGCDKITTITLTTNLTKIPNDAFRGCSSITNITIPNNVSSIGEYAFASCSKLSKVTIPEKVTSIGSAAFSNVASYIDVYFLGTVGKWCMISFAGGSANPLYTSGSELYINNSCLTNLYVSSATKISDYAFYNYKCLDSISMGSSVTSIGRYAFGHVFNAGGTYGPDKVTIGSNVTYIGDDAFYYNGNIKTLVIPDKVTTIGNSAFWGCGITSLTIGSSVSKIGTYAFYSNLELSNVTFRDTSTWYVTQSSSYSDGTQISVSSSSNNVKYFSTSPNYAGYYWYKK